MSKILPFTANGRSSDIFIQVWDVRCWDDSVGMKEASSVPVWHWYGISTRSYKLLVLDASFHCRLKLDLLRPEAEVSGNRGT